MSNSYLDDFIDKCIRNKNLIDNEKSVENLDHDIYLDGNEQVLRCKFDKATKIKENDIKNIIDKKYKNKYKIYSERNNKCKDRDCTFIDVTSKSLHCSLNNKFRVRNAYTTEVMNHLKFDLGN